MLAPPATPEQEAAEPSVEHVDEPTAIRLWDDVSQRLRDTLNETTYETWFSAAGGGSLNDGVFVVVVPNDFTREWIENHFLGLLRAATKDSLGREVRVALTVAETQPAEPVEPVRPTSTVRHPRRRSPGRTRSTRSTTS